VLAVGHRISPRAGIGLGWYEYGCRVDLARAVGGGCPSVRTVAGPVGWYGDGDEAWLSASVGEGLGGVLSAVQSFRVVVAPGCCGGWGWAGGQWSGAAQRAVLALNMWCAFRSVFRAVCL